MYIATKSGIGIAQCIFRKKHTVPMRDKHRAAARDDVPNFVPWHYLKFKCKGQRRKTVKKFIIIFIAALMLIAALPASADDVDQEKCEHAWHTGLLGGFYESVSNTRHQYYRLYQEYCGRCGKVVRYREYEFPPIGAMIYGEHALEQYISATCDGYTQTIVCRCKMCHSNYTITQECVRKHPGKPCSFLPI